ADADKVELALLQSFQQLIDTGRLGAFAREGGDEFARQADATHCDARLAGELLRPARKVEVRAFKLRLPEAALRAVEGIDTGIRERLEESAKLFRRLRELHRIVLLLPLGEAKNKRIIF